MYLISSMMFLMVLVNWLGTLIIVGIAVYYVTRSLTAPLDVLQVCCEEVAAQTAQDERDYGSILKLHGGPYVRNVAGKGSSECAVFFYRVAEAFLA